MVRSSSDLFARLCAPLEGDRIAARVLLVVAHPDDDVIAMGSRLPRLLDAHVAFVTDGAPRDGTDARRLGLGSRERYAALRVVESEAALGLVGVRPQRIRRFGIVDKEAMGALPELVERTVALVRELQPALLVTHAFEGGHPDHDATAFAVDQALRSLGEADLPAPELVEFPAYRAGADGRIVRQSFWPEDGSGTVVHLDEAARSLKRRMFACHASQAAILDGFPTDRELFRLAGKRDWLRFPHERPPLYQSYGWDLPADGWAGAVAGWEAGR